ncbi:protein-tyrosine phosphatase-like protein [Syncephalis pseudoplumigaleata]|uniref:Protein-tyrosine phosphatase-like protein n=1 Tax=Syncephalis pseudoplumigaleata TaxID=1712513 RepID=A0A4V1J230_9FUNG|nr:protein-tyrosine phosphatase-like protein [Syncephalis pseudoplumigaleata]|eukprot:RKP27129.1 protein-tyrosine phosphatase-like protein [Syncephalis pseudoplumigaleata]
MPMGAHRPAATAAAFGTASECIGTVPNSLLRDPFLPPPPSSLPRGLRLLQGEAVRCMVPPGCAILSQSIGEASPIEPKGDQPLEETDAVETICLLTNYRLYFQASTFPSAMHIPHTAVARVEVGTTHCALSLRFDARRYAIFFQDYVSATTGVCTPARECCRVFCSTLLHAVDPIEGTSGIFAFEHGESIRLDPSTAAAAMAATDPMLDIQTELFDIWQSAQFPTDQDAIDAGSDGVHEETVSTATTATDNDDEDEDEDDDLEPLSLSDARRREHLLGWHGGYDIHKEMKRTRLDAPGSCWQVEAANDTFDLSPSYPPRLILPTAGLPDATRRTFHAKLAAYRTRGRFPAVTWKNPRGHHIMMRAAQPLVGFLGARGPEDEWVVRECVRGAQRECGASVPFCILDARSYAAALSNGYAGGGYEKTDNYPAGTTINFLSLPNVHAVASAHAALLRSAATVASSRNWCYAPDAIAWMQHSTDLLEAAGGNDGVVAKMVVDDACVLIHCTDGWDRTTQLAALAQIMMDPYFRTLKGLRVVIEKDWVQFGHPFHARSQHAFTARYAHAPPPVASPVFLLFLTSLRQLLLQHPTAFEYNDKLLWCLAKVAAGYGPFTDFVCDSEAQRRRLNMRQRTRSVWQWIYEHRGWFLNPTYSLRRLSADWKDDVIRPDFSSHGASLWLDYYFPSPVYCRMLEALVSDIPANDAALVGDPSLQNGSAQFHQTWLFIKRRRRRLAASAFNRWRSQCGWKTSPWTSLLSMTSLASDDYCTLTRDSKGHSDDDRLHADHHHHHHRRCNVMNEEEEGEEEEGSSSGSSRGDSSDDSTLTHVTARSGGIGRPHDIASSWVEIPHCAMDQEPTPSPPTDGVRCHWKRASGAVVLWEEDVFAPDRPPKDGQVEWDENVFGPAAAMAMAEDMVV